MTTPPPALEVYAVDAGRLIPVSPLRLTEEAWRLRLMPEIFAVLRRGGTECAFTGALAANKAPGVYRCAGCGNDLFRADAKFESGTGWPSFFTPVHEANLTVVEDRSHGMVRTEVRCAVCDGHLGHVFEDGPPPTGLRYCINSAALRFQLAPPEGREIATFAAGCFWGVEETFRHIPGVLATRVGYTGGVQPNPTYEQVCTDRTGHAEAVRLEYDPGRATYDQLLDAFWALHDPTQKDRQGPDVGRQYRSAIFFHTPFQEFAARASARRLEESGRYRRPLATEITPAGPFYPAEDYHQRYLEKHGRGACPATPGVP
jgi:peptide methionine sulfoxide reductase msrA/msrB